MSKAFDHFPVGVGITMSVRVVARIRPLLENELERDVIVHADTTDGAKKANVVKIPNPKNESEEFSFTFNSVYDQQTTQEELFSAEGAPVPIAIDSVCVTFQLTNVFPQSLHISKPCSKASTLPFLPTE